MVGSAVFVTQAGRWLPEAGRVTRLHEDGTYDVRLERGPYEKFELTHKPDSEVNFATSEAEQRLEKKEREAAFKRSMAARDDERKMAAERPCPECGVKGHLQEHCPQVLNYFLPPSCSV